MRFIGLARRERSPVMMLKKGWAARRPDISRMVVPLLPAFRTDVGSTRPSAPTPWISKHSSAWLTEQELCLLIRAPRPRRHRSIDALSSPTHRFETWAFP